MGIGGGWVIGADEWAVVVGWMMWSCWSWWWVLVDDGR